MAAVPRPHAKRSDAECAAARVRRRARAAGPDRASEAGRVEWDLDKSAVQERVFDAHSASRAAIAAWFVADGPPDRAGEGPRGGRLVALPAPGAALEGLGAAGADGAAGLGAGGTRAGRIGMDGVCRGKVLTTEGRCGSASPGGSGCRGPERIWPGLGAGALGTGLAGIAVVRLGAPAAGEYG